MPTPKKGESKSEYMNRCIPILVREGKKPDQAVAICSSMFENKEKGKNEK